MRRAAIRDVTLAAAVTAAGLVASACGGDPPEAGELADAAEHVCAWDAGVPAAPQLTATVDGRLVAVDEDGRLRCLAPVGGDHIAWDPAGDRVVLDGATAVERDGSVRTVGPVAPPDLGGLRDVGPVVLHPDRTHRVAGGSSEGQDGVWAIPVEGGEPERLASGNDVAATDLAFGAEASRLWFAAVHGRESHLHVVDLVPTLDPDGDPMIGTVSDDVDPATGAPLGILPVAGHPLGLGALVPHPTDPGVIAYATGVCGDRRATVLTLPEVDAQPVVVPLDDGPAPSVPIGFLGAEEGTLRVVVALSVDGCAGPWDLWRVDVRDGVAADRALLVRGVDAAAVRVAHSEPAHTFVDVHITGFV